MLKLIKTKLHNNGTVYKKFTIKNDPSNTQYYLRIPTLELEEDVDYKWWRYEMLHVYTIDKNEFKNNELCRVVQDKIGIESFTHETFMKLLPNLNIVEEFTTIELNTYEEVIISLCDSELPNQERKLLG